MGARAAVSKGITCSFTRGYWQVRRTESQTGRTGPTAGTLPARGAAQVHAPATRQSGLRDPETLEGLTGSHAH
jgi:hypothetical protein